jgi:hypothetical protein
VRMPAEHTSQARVFCQVPESVLACVFECKHLFPTNFRAWRHSRGGLWAFVSDSVFNTYHFDILPSSSLRRTAEGSSAVSMVSSRASRCSDVFVWLIPTMALADTGIWEHRYRHLFPCCVRYHFTCCVALERPQRCTVSVNRLFESVLVEFVAC